MKRKERLKLSTKERKKKAGGEKRWSNLTKRREKTGINKETKQNKKNKKGYQIRKKEKK